MATTSSTNSVALDSISARHYPLMTSRGILSLVAAFALLAFSWRLAEVRPGVLLRPATVAAIWNFVSRLFPPDLSPEFLRTVLRAVAQTMATAVAGTLLSLTVALPLGVLATGTLWNRGVLVAADDRFAYGVGWMASRLARTLLGFLRAVPDLMAYTLYSFECCVRAAAVLGFVGAGGIGYEISVSMRMFEYGQVLTLLLVFIMLLTVTDAASRYLRARSVNRTDHAREVKAQDESSGLNPSVSNSRRLVGWTLVLFLVVASFTLAGFTPETLNQAGIAPRLAGFLRRMLPPDLSWSFVGSLGTALLQTIAISLMGTLIGLALAVVLAVPATSTLIFLRSDSPGRVRVIDRVLRWLLFWSTRLVLNILRSIPELVWVLICILAVGIGPFAGTIALGLHTAGVLGKLYAETMEEVPLRPVEALRSLGASPVQVLLWAIWPQARPLLSSYTVLRWETNLRASTMLGLVGGGGLGQAIYNNVQLGFYPRLTTLILLIYALVLASDWIGERLRLRVA